MFYFCALKLAGKEMFFLVTR